MVATYFDLLSQAMPTDGAGSLPLKPFPYATAMKNVEARQGLAELSIT
jgi:hypothetical protein